MDKEYSFNPQFFLHHVPLDFKLFLYKTVPNIIQLAVKTWLDAQHAKGVDVGDQFRTMGYLWQILCLSNPQKLEYALEHCGESLRVDVCRLYSDDLDTAVGLLSMQIERLRRVNLDLIA